VSDDKRGLTVDEVDAEDARELPEREEMSVIMPTGPGSPGIVPIGFSDPGTMEPGPPPVAMTPD
jgi:hypothetical protein